METDLQRYMRKYNDLTKLTEEFGIKTYRHSTLPLVGFKYNMIDSPKYHSVVRASRGTVLEDQTWNIVAQPFKRFYNYGEFEEERNKFDWGNFTVTEKVDGSLIIMYFYEGEWRINTSGSFGDGQAGLFSGSWVDLFFETAHKDITFGVTCKLNPNFTYMFELCTLYNKVVRLYPDPKVYLLGVFDILHGYELSYGEVVEEAKRLGISNILVPSYNMTSIDEILEFLHEKESSDPSFEGVVIRDRQNIRFKVKSESYLRLHHMADNGNIANPKHYIPFLLKGEKDEVCTYFPELKSLLDKEEEKLQKEFGILIDLWKECYTIESQKEFALAINKRTKYTSILFSIRKEKGTNQTLDDLKEFWMNSADLVVKVMYD